MSTEPSDRQNPDTESGVPPEVDPDEVLPEYDFRTGERGKYAARYAQGTNVVVLDPDVAAVFPTAEAVNAALRALADVARRQATRAPSGA